MPEDKTTQLVIKGYDSNGGRDEHFSLARDFVSEEVEVLRDPPRRIDSTDAFNKLGQAYNKARDRFPDQGFIPTGQPNRRGEDA